jgi:DNA (cytosine-5)-methyltransferase 1
VPRLLDLFCGAGGAAVGYSRAGFDVVGVDIEPQPHYPFEFHRGNALAVLAKVGGAGAGHAFSTYDAIHASPPCQAYTRARRRQDHPDLYEATRDLVEATGLPYVIENVVEAPFRQGIKLCGSMFGLPIHRHRNFECSFAMLSPGCRHDGRAWTVSGHSNGPNGNENAHSRDASLAKGGEVMGIDWMDWDELTQAIPPAYTEWIGAQLIRHLSVSLAPPIQEKP